MLMIEIVMIIIDMMIIYIHTYDDDGFQQSHQMEVFLSEQR